MPNHLHSVIAWHSFDIAELLSSDFLIGERVSRYNDIIIVIAANHLIIRYKYHIDLAKL